MALMEEKIACSKCNKGHAAYVPYCPYCGAMQPSKPEHQDKSAQIPVVEESPLEFDPVSKQTDAAAISPRYGTNFSRFDSATKATEDAEQLKAGQDSNAAKEKAEQQAKDELAAAKNRVDSTADQTVQDVGAHQEDGMVSGHTIVKSVPSGGTKKMAIIFLSLVGLAVVGFFANMASKSQRDSGQVSSPVQPVPMPTSPETKPKPKTPQQAISIPTKIKSEPQQQATSVPINKLVLSHYDMLLNPTTVHGGDSVITESKIQLIGHSNSVPRVEETLVLVAPDGRESRAQFIRVAAVDGAGSYSTSGKINLSKRLELGSYTVKSTLTLDGEVVANRQVGFRIAPDDNLPQPIQPRQNEKVVQLLSDAKKFIAQGNYKQAEESMKFCLMLDSENQECQQMKQKAAQLNDRMFDCVGSGKEWVDGRCN